MLARSNRGISISIGLAAPAVFALFCSRMLLSLPPGHPDQHTFVEHLFGVAAASRQDFGSDANFISKIIKKQMRTTAQKGIE